MTLPRFSPGMPLVDKDGRATPLFRDWINQFSNAVEAADTDLQEQITRLEQLVRAVSFPEGATIQGSDAGSDATVSVTGHTRVYQDGTVSVDAGAVTGLAYGQASYVYYDDPDNAGGAVTYAATTDLAEAVPSDTNPGRHFVGAVTTPTAGNPPTTGNPSAGAGAVQA